MSQVTEEDLETLSRGRNGDRGDNVECSQERSTESSALERDRLVGPVVKVSASRAEDPGFEFRLCRDFFGVESY